MDISCKFLKQVGPKKRVGWGKKLDGKFANRVGWKMKKVGPNKGVGWKIC